MSSFARSGSLLGQFVLVAVIFASLPLLAQDKASEKEWKKNTDKAENAFKRNQFNDAADLYAAAAANAENFPTDDPRLSETLLKQAKVGLQLGEYSDAESAIRRALTLDEKRLGTNDERLAGDFIGLGESCMFAHRYEEADIYFVRAQTLFERKFGRFDRTVGLCLEERGRAALGDERFTDAEKYLKEALELAESPRVKTDFQINQYAQRWVQNPNQGQVAQILNDLGILYLHMKRYDESEDSFRKSLKLLEGKYGKNSLFLCNPLSNYADTLIASHKYADGEKQLRHCLSILEWAKADHPLIVSVQQRLNALKAVNKNPASSPAASQ
jgi:tetratricopeptide (TPR) repeat protein